MSHRKSHVTSLQSPTVSKVLKELHQLDPANNMDKFCSMPISLIMYHPEKLSFREVLSLTPLH